MSMFYKIRKSDDESFSNVLLTAPLTTLYGDLELLEFLE